MNFIKNKKAFTLIELLVVIAVIGILVLLGIPRFIGHTQKAELTRIQHDIKVMEQEVGTVLSTDYDDFNEWEDNNKDLNQLIQEGKLFEKEGVATGVEPIDGAYKIIPESYKSKINTKLKGTFYANSNGKVYYEHLKPLSGIPAEPEKEPVLEGPIPIATAEELDSIRKTEKRTYGAGTQWEGLYEGGLDKQYIQVADIDLSEYSKEEEGWNPIGTFGNTIPEEIVDYSLPFEGIYDGGNYVIRGLEVKGKEERYQGLFGYTEGATIRNVGLIDNKVTGTNDVGGLVGMAGNSTIENSYATGSVEGSDRVGGLVGSAYDGKIENSYATGSVKGSGDSVGGLVGLAYGVNIKNSYSTGPITSTGEYSNAVGGLVGRAHMGATIINSYATGSVTGSSDDKYSGGLVGGLVGYADYSTIENSYSTGKVEGTGDNVGGLAGTASTGTHISNSYATGSVTGGGYVGGLVGEAGGSTIENSYATGSVTGSGSEYTARGLVGRANKSTNISNSYWDIETTKQTESAGQDESFGKTTEEMKKADTYSAWNTDVWNIVNGDYPKLR